MFNFISDMFFNSDPYQTETLLDFFFLNDAAIAFSVIINASLNITQNVAISSYTDRGRMVYRGVNISVFVPEMELTQ